MSALTEFLLARIAEDEAAARACAEVYPSPWDVSDRGWLAYVRADAPGFREVVRLEQEYVEPGTVEWLGDALAHIARWDPARVLAECEAKRRIVEDYVDHVQTYRDEPTVFGEGQRFGLTLTLAELALVWADHPDYRQEWRP